MKDFPADLITRAYDLCRDLGALGCGVEVVVDAHLDPHPADPQSPPEGKDVFVRVNTVFVPGWTAEGEPPPVDVTVEDHLGHRDDALTFWAGGVVSEHQLYHRPQDKEDTSA